MALMEIAVIPIGSGTSVSDFIAKAVLALEGIPDIDYELTSMGTIVSGEVDQLLAAAQKMHQTVLEAGANRVETIIRIDDRKDKLMDLTSKLDAVRRKLGDRD
jgi:uncharacterized protein (TIGR00106 family)